MISLESGSLHTTNSPQWIEKDLNIDSKEKIKQGDDSSFHLRNFAWLSSVTLSQVFFCDMTLFFWEIFV